MFYVIVMPICASLFLFFVVCENALKTHSGFFHRVVNDFRTNRPYILIRHCLEVIIQFNLATYFF